MNVLALGGSHTLLKVVKRYLQDEAVDHLTVIISPRHEKELNIDKKSLGKLLHDAQKEYPSKFKAIHVLQTLRDDKFIESCAESDLNLSISAAWIYNQWHLSHAQKIYQMHNTLLPNFRGGASISWQILCGERQSATTLFEIDEGVDTGKIVYSDPYIFPSTCRKPIDYLKYAESKAIDSLVEFLRLYKVNSKVISASSQQESFASYFPRLNTELNGCIDWDWTAEEVERFLLAFDDPYQGAHTKCTSIDGKIYLKDVISIHQIHKFHPFQAGVIYNKDKLGLHICCKDGGILVGKASDSNGKNLIDSLNIGDRLYNTSEDLTAAKSSRIRYTPKN